ncbi:hypothetical protein [Streptomyces subrutilus]|uniref:hypothetical protein n=1 Tax=Streptomyces subrutilus TaxID=36818 RepID=UPI002E131101|nr:hypothetical protein OG479_34350 [Streptomyces subrutilus]
MDLLAIPELCGEERAEGTDPECCGEHYFTLRHEYDAKCCHDSSGTQIHDEEYLRILGRVTAFCH